MSTGSIRLWNAYLVTHLNLGDAIAHRYNSAHDRMARKYWQGDLNGPVAVDSRQIGMTNATGCHFH
ncbi:hypothetical protein G8759_14355 [Spirosoma aureum]|uniref:Uncharacterized protein n=1 Tax=Spirosoma aureum TaxID=2692134 RepID=A0A6G9AN60_9BACT|nr:hypothetical protein [Spirosoma aureum]QIP13715.1 hypothetical protein G8759_14355 [Spirosoma aureum]